MDTDAMQSPAGDSSMMNKRKKRKGRKKANRTDEQLIMNQMQNNVQVRNIEKTCIAVSNDLQNNLIEINSTPRSQFGSSGMDKRLPETVPGSTVQRETRKRKWKKKKAKNEGELQSMNQMDDHLEVPPINRLCNASNNDLKNNPNELDSTAQSHAEPSKMDARSLTLPPGGTVVKNIKKTKWKEKKAQNEVVVQSMSQMDDHLEVPNIGKLSIAGNSDLKNLHMKQSKPHTILTDNITEGTGGEKTEVTEQRKQRKKRRNKTKAKNEGNLESFDQMDDHYAGKSFPGAHCDLLNNAMELDSTVQYAEQSQMGTRSLSAENITEGTEGTGQRKKRKKKRNRAKVKNEGDLQSFNQMDNRYAGKKIPGSHSDLTNNAMDLDSTVQSHVEQSKMDTRSMSIENNTEGERTEETEQRKRRKKRRNKKKAKNEGDFQHVAQMDDHRVGKTLPRTHNDLWSNLMEQSKMDTGSIENISEGSEQKKKGRRKHKSRKAKNTDELQSVDQMDDNLAVPSVGVGCTVANCDLQNNLTGLDCTAQLHAKQSMTDSRSTEHLVEATFSRKKRRKPKKTKAENKDELQHLNKTDDKLEVPSTAIDLGCTVAYNNLQNNLIELDSAAQLLAEQSNSGTRSTENCVEGIARGKRKRRDRNKKRVNTKDELQSAAIMSTTNLFDMNPGMGNDNKPITNESTTSSLQDTVSPVGLNTEKTPLAPADIGSRTYPEFVVPGSGPSERPREMEIEMLSCEYQHLSLPVQISGKNENIMNESDEEEIIVYQGKNSAACSSGGMEVTKHLSSSILKEDHFSNDSSLCPEIPRGAFVRRKLLVLDVNGLLADIVMPAPKDSVADTRMLGRAVFKRPFCNDFLKFCFEKFDVAIWSSRSKRVIDKVVDYLLGDLQQKLLFCWDMSHSTQTMFKTLENKHKPLVMKELKKIWEKDDPNLPWERGYYDKSNTLLLDDSPYKALLNPPHTAIFPYSYQYKDKGDNSLGPGGSLRVYLEDILKCDNVKEFVEQHPFGQGAIDETHASWSFYSMVLNSVSNKSV